MIGLGFRREMLGWDMSAVAADFFEVAPENWLRRDRAPLHRLLAQGCAVHLHGVSLNLGGLAPLDMDFVRSVRALMDELGAPHYSDHLAATGDAWQLYDLFPVPLTEVHARRVADRVARVQDVLGRPMAVENTTWYTNVGEMDEADFLMDVVRRAGCGLLLDVNNLSVNHKNHGYGVPQDFVQRMDRQRVTYVHVAGHEWDARLGLFMDTHSAPVEACTRALAQQLQRDWGVPLLLEWDNDVPSMAVINEELACLRPSLIS